MFENKAFHYNSHWEAAAGSSHFGGKVVVALIVAKEWCMYETANSIHEGAVLS